MTSDNRAPQEKLRLLLEASRLPETEHGSSGDGRSLGRRPETLRVGGARRPGWGSAQCGGPALHPGVGASRNAKQEQRLREGVVLIELQKNTHELWG